MIKKQVHIIKGLSSILLLLAVFTPAHAQDESTFKSYIDSTRMEVGNQTVYHMELTTSQGATVYWPVYEQGIHPVVDVLSYDMQDTLTEGIMQTLKREMLLMPFDTGYHALPPTFVIIQSGGKIDTLFSESHLLEVYGPEVDTTAAFKPIKPIKEEPLTLMEILPIVMASYFGISALILLIWFIRKLIKREPLLSPVVKPMIPPHTEAIRALNKLKKKKLWQSGEYKLFYTELTDILRNYIDRQLEVPAPEQTSDEILSSLEKEKLTPQLFEGLKNLFRTADFVKFAKMLPNDDDNEINLKTAYRFVDEVHQKMIVESENQEKAS